MSLQLSPQSQKPQSLLRWFYSVPPPSAAGAQGECLRKKFCALALEQSTCVSSRVLSLPGGQNPRWFLLSDIEWAPLPNSDALRLVTSFGLTPHTSQGEPLHLGHPYGISEAAHGSRASPLHIFVIHVSLSVTSVNPWLWDLSSVGYSKWLFYILVVIPVWFWEEVSVTSTYFATVLDFLSFWFY